MRHHLPQALGLLLLLAGLPAPASAQPAILVADLQGPVPPNGEGSESSFPMGFQAAGGKLFFTAFEPSTGFEVWASDGTAAGTELLGDLCPGLCSFDISPVGTLGPLAFWRTSLSEPFRPPQLWRSNGTPAGTFPLSGGGEDLETAPGAPGGIDLNGILYLLGCTRTLGCGVWRTDGTQGGTRLVLPLLFPGFGGGDQLAFGPLLTAGGKLFAFGGPPSGDETDVWVSNGTPGGSVRIATLPHREDHLFTAAGDRVFFVAAVAGKGEELWVSDGTRAGTRPVSRFAPDLPFGSTVALKAVGNRVYFPADDGVHGTELWTSDGTPRGTRRVTDLSYPLPFARSDATSALSGIAAVGDRVLFAAYDGTRFGLWQTDGDPGSTTRLAAEIPGDSPLVPVGGKVLFTAPKGLRRQLWATDGTPAGTRFLHPLVSRPVVARGVAYFAAIQSSGPVHLWRTDGSPAGTREVSPVPTLDLTNRDLEVVSLRGRLYFAGAGELGTELWSSDGTPAGTGMVADLARSGPGSNPHDGVALGDRLLFTAVTDGALRIWATEGTPASTVPLTPPMGIFGGLSEEEVVGGLAFFWRDPDDEPAFLWRTDGTPGGTFPLIEARLRGPAGRRVGVARTLPKLGAGSSFAFGQVDGKVVFSRDSPTASELWKSDGTLPGTQKIVTLPDQLSVTRYVTVGEEVCFTTLGNTSRQLWRTDGTASGTRKLADVDFEANALGPELVRTGTGVYFLGADPAGGEHLWRTDGTGGGTRTVVDFPSADSPLNPAGPVALGETLYFLGDTADGGRALWRSDGTAAGTAVVQELFRDLPTDLRTGLTVFAGRLYFSARDEEHGRELWTSDGTPEGTVLLRDVDPGASSADPMSLTVAGGRLFFAANDSVHGNELWQTDGSAAGTRLVQDIAPEARSAFPVPLAVVGDHLYFAADDGEHGREVWSLPLARP